MQHAVTNDKIRNALRRLIAERGLDMSAVSRAIGKNHAYIQQYLTRGVPADLGYKTALALAEYFGCGLEIFGIRAPGAASNDAAPAQTSAPRHPLQSIRRLTGLGPAAFARALNVPEAEIVAIESGEKPLPEKLLLRVCNTFQIDPADFAGYAPALSESERVMLMRLRQLTPAQTRTLETILRKFEKERA
ncbi:MAG: transcriptional regulator [Alphaproteobacteria bacterium]|nr:transcriptional regulator [Alphaproteobacteria bacterium]USO07987.1 MAG: transcriptional regulator [Rhodospirillales bacterium]